MFQSIYLVLLGVARSIAYYFDGVLLSSRSYKSIVSQRDSAVQLLAKAKEDFIPGLTGIVFSKDRALQLYSLLSSYHSSVKNPADLVIIYNASSKEHLQSYNELERYCCEISTFKVSFVLEGEGFKETLNNQLKKIITNNIFFLVDDIIFIKDLDLNFAKKINSKEYILSLRHSPALNYSYNVRRYHNPPQFIRPFEGVDILEFSWFESPNEWSDPLSVDGHILPTAEVGVIAEIADYKAPNSFEAILKTFSNLCVDRKGLCYLESKILNIPINRVQTESKNYSGDVSVEYLLKRWSGGEQINLDQFSNYCPHSTHEEHPVTFKTRLRFPATPDGNL